MYNQEKKILERIKEFAKKLPHFQDGRIDYSKSNTALVLTVFIKYLDRILLLKRSNKVSTYQGKWNTVAGYLDEAKPLLQKILEEVKEEVGINKTNILQYKIGKSFSFTDPILHRTWIVHPTMIELKDKPKIKLDWEHSKYVWITIKEINQYDTVPNLKKSIEKGIL